MEFSLTETFLSLILVALSLALTCALARYPRKAIAGVSLGVLVGGASLTLTSAFVGFLAHVLPMGQIDYWLITIFRGR